MKRIAFVVITIFVSTLLVVALLSVAFMIELRFRARHSDPTIQWLDQRQVVLRPYGLWTHPTLRAGTNEDGFRFHREFTLDPPPGATRIAIFGGSAVWGTGVAESQTIAAHMEQALARRGVPDPEVLNFGVGGFDSTTELIQLELNALPYKPDTVVIFDGWNDLAARRFVPHLNDIAARYKTVLDQANFGVSGLRLSIENALLNTYTGRPFAYLFRYSPDQEERDSLVRETAERDMKQEVRRPPEEWSSEVYATNLKTIAGVLRAHDIDVLFAFQPYNVAEFEAEGWQDEREPYLDFERAFFQSCLETGSRCYSFDGAFEGPEVNTNAFLDIVHLSDFGGRVIGTVLADLVAPQPGDGGDARAGLPRAGWIELQTKPEPGGSEFPFSVRPREPEAR